MSLTADSRIRRIPPAGSGRRWSGNRAIVRDDLSYSSERMRLTAAAEAEPQRQLFTRQREPIK
jgi:hypothetical protein